MGKSIQKLELTWKMLFPGCNSKVDACTKHASGAGGSLARGGATSCRMSSPAKIELVAVI